MVTSDHHGGDERKQDYEDVSLFCEGASLRGRIGATNSVP